MVGAGLSFWLARVDAAGLALVVVFLAINWFGDSLDGTLARVRQHQRPRYGYYVDHVVDVFGALFLFGGLALSGYMSPAVAGAADRLFHACRSRSTSRRSVRHVPDGFFKIGPTELRILLAIGNLVLLVHPNARSSATRSSSSTSAASSASPACSSPC